MKIRKLNILSAAAFGMLAFAGCKKDDGPVSSRVDIQKVPTITTNIDATGSQAIDVLNPSTFQGKFKVANYFEGTTPPTKVDVVVRKNGAAANVKVFKANVTSLPANFTVTAAELTTLFGTAPVLGDTYDFAPNTYVGDKLYEAFPATGIGTGTGHNGSPGFSEFARFAAICAYDPAIYQGNFVVVSDAFGDFTPGEIVVFTQVSPTSFSFIDPYVTNPLPIIVKVNPLNNQVTVTKQKIGNAFTWNTGYTNPNVTVAASTTSVVTPCDKRIVLAMTFSVDQGSFAPYNLVLRKQ